MKFLSRLFSQSLSRLWNTAITKYVVVLLVAGTWMLLFDRYNLQAQREVQTQIRALQEDKAYYETAINQVDYEVDQLFSDEEELERYAREHYYFKRSNEDVFVIVE